MSEHYELYQFNLGDLCGYCGEGVIESRSLRLRYRYNKDCMLCEGSGSWFVSGSCDAWVECDCGFSFGKKQASLYCPCCKTSEPDLSTKKLASRARAYLRWLLIKKDKNVIEHIESQFKDGMTWDNRSEWHIDHIKPIKAFLDEGITDPAVINALDNLQPLWAHENLSKGAKWEMENTK